MTDDKKIRLRWIDFLKGFAMLVVIYEHTSLYYRQIAMFIVPVAMPLFFILSGYLSNNPTKLNFSEYCKNKAKRLLIPYTLYQIFLTVFYTIYNFATSGNFNGFGRHIIGIFYGRYMFFNKASVSDSSNIFFLDGMNSVLWFLPAMFFASLVYYLVVKLYEKSGVYGTIAILICLCISAACFYLPILLPWSLDTCWILAVFMVFGRFIRKYGDKIKVWLSILAGAAYLVICYFNQGENTSIRRYGSAKFGACAILPYLLMGCLGAMALIGVIKQLYDYSAFSDNAVTNYISWIGKKSLTFMSIQFLFINTAGDLASLFISNRFVKGGIQFAVALVGCSIVAMVFDKIMIKRTDSIVKYL